jgi:hypothetical protein
VRAFFTLLNQVSLQANQTTQSSLIFFWQKKKRFNSESLPTMWFDLDWTRDPCVRAGSNHQLNYQTYCLIAVARYNRFPFTQSSFTKKIFYFKDHYPKFFQLVCLLNIFLKIIAHLTGIACSWLQVIATFEAQLLVFIFFP